MTIAITGDKGFIGSNFTDFLRNKNGMEIRLFDAEKYSLLEKESLKDFVKDVDLIVHFAGVNRGSDKEVFEGNVFLAYNIISAVKDYNPKAALFYISSIQAEERLESPYGASKRLAELMLENFSRKFNLWIGVFRLSNVFGQGCKPFYNSVVATFCYQLANNQNLTINPASQKYNFIYVQDVIDIIFDRIVNLKNNKKFFLEEVRSKNNLTVSDLADLIKNFKKGEKSDIIKKEMNVSEKFYNDLKETYNSYLNYKLNL